MAITLALFFLLFSVSTLGVGLACCRFLKVSNQHTLIVAFALSVGFLYGSSWFIYVFKLDLLFHFAILIINVCGFIYWLVTGGRKHWRAVFLPDFALYLCYLALVITQLALIRSYSGGGWSGDWFEHYQRALFFLERWPIDHQFLSVYAVSARPPLMNVVAGHFLMLMGKDFFLFQLVFTSLNTLAVIPALYLVRLFTEKLNWQRYLFFLAIIACNPLMLENNTYTWTRQLTVFFILSTLLFYYQGWRTQRPHYLVFAFYCLSLGSLTHYSAGPYVVIFGVHFIWLFFAKRFWQFWRINISIAAVCLGILGSWFGWSYLTYGVDETMSSNSFIESNQQTSNEEITDKIIGNYINTFVPHLLRGVYHDDFNPSDTPLSLWISRHAFFSYQTNLFFSLGSFSWLFLLAYLWKRFQLKKHETSSVFFWSWFCLGAYFIGVGVNDVPKTYGIVHICLQPITVLGLAVIASHSITQLRYRIVFVLGLGIDFCLGIGSLLYYQNIAVPNKYLGLAHNGTLKLKNDLQLVFLGDLWAHYHLALSLLIVLAVFVLLINILRKIEPQTTITEDVQPT